MSGSGTPAAPTMAPVLPPAMFAPPPPAVQTFQSFASGQMMMTGLSTPQMGFGMAAAMFPGASATPTTYAGKFLSHSKGKVHFYCRKVIFVKNVKVTVIIHNDHGTLWIC